MFFFKRIGGVGGAGGWMRRFCVCFLFLDCWFLGCLALLQDVCSCGMESGFGFDLFFVQVCLLFVFLMSLPPSVGTLL